jgi:hypothetical protein
VLSQSPNTRHPNHDEAGDSCCTSALEGRVVKPEEEKKKKKNKKKKENNKKTTTEPVSSSYIPRRSGDAVF